MFKTTVNFLVFAQFSSHIIFSRGKSDDGNGVDDEDGDEDENGVDSGIVDVGNVGGDPSLNKMKDKRPRNSRVSNYN